MGNFPRIIYESCSIQCNIEVEKLFEPNIITLFNFIICHFRTFCNNRYHFKKIPFSLRDEIKKYSFLV